MLKPRLSHTASGLVMLYGTSVMMSFGYGMTIPAIPDVQQHFALSNFWAAQLVTAYAVGRLIGTPPAGIIVDKLGSRVAMLLGPALITTAAVTVFLSPWFPLILAILVLTGAGDATWMIGREIAGIELVKPEQRGRMMSGFMGSNSAGQALGPVLGGILAQRLDYHAVYGGYAMLGILVLVLSIFAPMAIGTRVATRYRGPVQPWSLWREVSLPYRIVKRMSGIPALVRQIEPGFRTTYVVLVFATFTMMLYRMVMQSILPLYVVTYRGYSKEQLGFLLGIQGLIVIAMILPAGLVTDKLGRKWATVPSTAIPALSFLLLPFTSSLIFMGGLIALMGLANGLSLGSVATSTYDVIPAAARGRLQALRRTTSETGSITGPTVGGLIASLANPGVAFLAAGPLLVAAALLIWGFAKETLHVRPVQTAPG